MSNFTSLTKILAQWLFLCGLCAGQALAQANTLSGTLSMPQGVVPVSSPATFRIQTVPLETVRLSNGQLAETATTVTIPTFSNSVAYSLPLRDLDGSVPLPQRQRKLKFDCLSGCANIAISTTGFWSTTQGVVWEANATEFDTAVIQVVDITLERADLFTGVILLPEGLQSAGNEVFTVQITGSQFNNPAVFEQRIPTQAGQDRWGFFVGVPPDETGGSWTLTLICDSCSDSLIAGPFFASTREGDPLSVEIGQRFSFAKNRSYSNLRLSIPKAETETHITAVISLLLDD